jgi:DNA polymerase
VTDAERRAALEAIAREVAVCTRCRLHSGRSRAVPGEGSADTEVVFVGEGPGEQEDRQGRPFVGASGQLLTELVQSLGWRREDVYITNVVKCRPPGNRDPQPDEIAACSTFLRRQLEALDPAVVVTVGKHSLNSFRPGERIGRVHGTTTPANPDTGAANALVFSMYHPAFALYQGSNRATLFDDIAGLPAALLASRARREAAPASAATVPGIATTIVAEPAPATTPGRDAVFAMAGLLAVELAEMTDPDADSAADVTVIESGAGGLLATDRHPLPLAGDPADPADQLTLF